MTKQTAIEKKEFLKNNNDFNLCSKALFNILKSNPKVKIPNSWNFISAQLASAIGEVYFPEQKDFNINTLKDFYKDKDIVEKLFLMDVVINNIIKGTLRDFAKNIFEAIKISKSNGNTDLYDIINDENQVIIESINAAFFSCLNPEHHLDKEEKDLLMNYGLNVNQQDFDYYSDLYISESDKIKGVKHSFMIGAFYTLKEKSIDSFFIFLRNLGEYIQDDNNYSFVSKQIEDKNGTDFLFKRLEQEKLNILNDLYN